MEKTLIKIIMTDIGAETDVHIENDKERLAVAISLSALFLKDTELLKILAYVAEKNLRHPEEFEKKIITVKGGIPWDNNKPNNQ